MTPPDLIRHVRFPLSVLTLAVLTTLSANAAPLVPDAGQTSRELEKSAQPEQPKAVAPLRIEGADAATPTGDGAVHFLVTGFHISGNSIVDSNTLAALLDDLAGHRLSLRELNTGVARITSWYRQHGYAIARAYLPAQDIKDGIVEVRILEGRLDQQRIDNRSGLSDQRARAYLDGIHNGDILVTQDVDRALMLLNDTPGVGGARATLQPGASVGTSDLVVELTPGRPYAGSVDLDNYGNRYTGQYRLGSSLAINSPLGIGDQISVRALTSVDQLDYVRFAYQVPLGASGLRLGAAYSDTRYRLGKEFSSLQAGGNVAGGSLFVVYPLIRSQRGNLSATLSWEHKHLVGKTDTPQSNITKDVNLVALGLSGNRQDSLGGAGNTSFEVNLASGHLNMDALSETLDQASAQTDNQFARLSYNLSRLQRVSDNNNLYLAVAGQEASKNLNSSEKFSLGGANGVRAYPQGEASGDRGWLANLEWRYRFRPNLQAVIFYDAGSVDFNRNPFTTASNRRTLSGGGIGLDALLEKWQFKTYLAWPFSGGAPTSEPADATHSPRLWALASYSF